MLLSLLVANAIGCSGSSSRTNTSEPVAPRAAPVDAGSSADAAPVTVRERKARAEIEKLRVGVCGCASKACSDRYVAALYGFLLAHRTDSSFSTAGVQEIAAVSGKIIDCAAAKGTDRAVINRLVHSAALTVDRVDEIEKQRDLACDCKALTCSETMLLTYALFTYINAGRRVKAEEASRIGGAANALQNCLRSVGMPDARIQATLKKALGK